MHTTSPADFNPPTPFLLGTLAAARRRDLTRAARRTGPVFREVGEPDAARPAESLVDGVTCGDLRGTRERLRDEARRLLASVTAGGQ